MLTDFDTFWLRKAGHRICKHSGWRHQRTFSQQMSQHIKYLFIRQQSIVAQQSQREEVIKKTAHFPGKLFVVTHSIMPLVYCMYLFILSTQPDPNFCIRNLKPDFIFIFVQTCGAIYPERILKQYINYSLPINSGRIHQHTCEQAFKKLFKGWSCTWLRPPGKTKSIF